MKMTENIKAVIEAQVPNSTAYVFDPYNDNTHFSAVVVSENFKSIPLVKQHQQVMNALKDHFASTVHAMQLKTFTPEKWQLEKHHYNIQD